MQRTTVRRVCTWIGVGVAIGIVLATGANILLEATDSTKTTEVPTIMIDWRNVSYGKYGTETWNITTDAGDLEVTLSNFSVSLSCEWVHYLLMPVGDSDFQLEADMESFYMSVSFADNSSGASVLIDDVHFEATGPASELESAKESLSQMIEDNIEITRWGLEEW